jgi:predicted DNA-binding ribbon-helix-helix protein
MRIAAQRGRTLASLVAAADAERTPSQPLASALRVMALRVFDQEAASGPATDPPTAHQDTE